nr:TatD family hydrolase [uncultured Carboxylicivirga sp.]
MIYIDFHTHQINKEADVKSIYNLPLTKIPADFSEQYLSSGIHPWYINDNINNQFRTIKLNINHPNVIAIGECGLDKLKGPDLAIQTEVFKQHISWSEEFEIPLIIHCVKAYTEIIKLRKDLKPKQTWIFHGFNSSVETLNQAIKTGFYFSFSPAIINHSKTHNSFLNSPINRIFLETDDTDFNIKELYKKAAELKEINIDEFKEKIRDNFKLILHI